MADIDDATMSDDPSVKGNIWVLNYNGLYDENYHSISYGFNSSKYPNAIFLFSDSASGVFEKDLKNFQYLL